MAPCPPPPPCGKGPGKDGCGFGKLSDESTVDASEDASDKVIPTKPEKIARPPKFCKND